MTAIFKSALPIAAKIEYRTIVLVVLAVAFTLRLVWAVEIPVIPISDETVYDILARVLAEHGVYGWAYDRPTASWPVGTSAIYAALYALFGHNFIPIVILNVALGTAIVGLTLWLTKIFCDQRTSILAGCLMAIWPSNVMWVTILSSELPFTFLVLLAYLAWYHSNNSKSVVAIGSGLAFAAATYVRPVALLLPVILWLSAVPNWRKLRAQIPILLLTLVVTVIAIAPWSIRNTRLFDHFVMLSTNGGVNLWIGNNPNATGYYMPTPAPPPGMNEYEQDQMLGQEAKRYIFERPLTFLLRSLKKAAILHFGETIAVHWNAEAIKQRLGESAVFPLKLLTQVYWTGVLLLAFVGLAVMSRDLGLLNTLMHPAVLTWAYFTGFYAIFFGGDRFHIPSHPFIAVLAANAIVFVAESGFQKDVARNEAVVNP